MGPLRNCLQASPAVVRWSCPGKRACGWISTFISRPGMLVKAGAPDCTLFQTGALLPGWVTWRSCCVSCAGGTGSCCGACCACCAIAAPAKSRTARKENLIYASCCSAALPSLDLIGLLVDAFVFVLALLAGLELGFPAGAVALAPLAAAVGERVIVPGLAVALALVALLRGLLLHDLLALRACGQRIRDDHEEKDLF